MIRFTYPDGSSCFRALQTVHAIFHDEAGRLLAPVQRTDATYHEFEIAAFELLEPGKSYP